MSVSRYYFASASVGSAVVAILAVHSQTAYADAADSSEPAGLEEIIVTAQKREQRISDVGATIGVVTGKDMQNLGITEPNQLATVVPGFTAAVSQTGAPLFALRGINVIAAKPTSAFTFINQ